MKEKYLHHRRVVYGDASDPFAPRKKKMNSSTGKIFIYLIGTNFRGNLIFWIWRLSLVFSFCFDLETFD